MTDSKVRRGSPRAWNPFQPLAVRNQASLPLHVEFQSPKLAWFGEATGRQDTRPTKQGAVGQSVLLVLQAQPARLNSNVSLCPDIRLVILPMLSEDIVHENCVRNLSGQCCEGQRWVQKITSTSSGCKKYAIV